MNGKESNGHFPSRELKLSRFDSQGVSVTWKDEEERQRAEGMLNDVETAFSSIIGSLGDPNPEREGLKKTPRRAAKALLYFTKGYEEDLESKCVVKGPHVYKPCFVKMYNDYHGKIQQQITSPGFMFGLHSFNLKK